MSASHRIPDPFTTAFYRSGICRTADELKNRETLLAELAIMRIAAGRLADRLVSAQNEINRLRKHPTEVKMSHETTPLSAVQVEPVVGHVLVCEVGGKPYYGTELEAIAARLEHGDKVVFNGMAETVDYTWFFDGPIIKLESGKSIFPALGQSFEVVPTETEAP